MSPKKQDKGKAKAIESSTSDACNRAKTKVKKPRGRKRIYPRDENGNVIIELDEFGNRKIPKQKYKSRARTKDRQNTPLASQPKVKPTFGDSRKAQPRSSPPYHLSSEAGPGPFTMQKRKAREEAEDIQSTKRPRWSGSYDEEYDDQTNTESPLEEYDDETNMESSPEDSDDKIDKESSREECEDEIDMESSEEESEPPQSPDSAVSDIDAEGEDDDENEIIFLGEQKCGAEEVVEAPQPIDVPANEVLELWQVNDGSQFERQWTYSHYPAYREDIETGLFEERNLTVYSVEPWRPWSPDEEELPSYPTSGDGSELFQSQAMKDLMVYFGLEEEERACDIFQCCSS